MYGPLLGRKLPDRTTRCIGENVEERNAEGTRKGRRRDRTRDRKIRHDPICMHNLNKKMQSCTEMMQPAQYGRVTIMTTANSSDVLTSLNNLNSNGISNDGVISTDGSGNITAAGGKLRNVTMLASPYQLTTNPTVTSGATSTLTCTGVGSIPSGAIAVMIGGGIFAVTTGGYAWVSPHGGTAGQYVGVAGMPGNAFTACSFTVPLDATGKIDVKANSSNIVLQAWYIYGYII